MQEQNVYARFLKGVLSFKTVEATADSVKRLNELYGYFERLHDRAGQHEVMALALKGINRARWGNKKDSAQLLFEFLITCILPQ